MIINKVNGLAFTRQPLSSPSWPFALLVVTLLSACGGGSGGDPAEGDTGGGNGGGGNGSGSDGSNPDSGNTPVPAPLKTGDFSIIWDKNSLTISQGGRTVWQTKPGQSLVGGGIHDLHAEESRGSFTIEEKVNQRCETSSVSGIKQDGNAVVLSGTVTGAPLCASDFTVRFEQIIPGHLQYKVRFSNTAVNYTRFNFASEASERFHGMGEQYTQLDLKGHRVPVLSEEGGVGRGRLEISAVVNAVSRGSGGTRYTTYYAVPHFISSRMRSLFLENTEYSVFDLRESDTASIELFSGQMTGRILAGATMLDLIERFTEYTGRMRPLPDWFNEGAILGLQGGTARVNGILDELKKRRTPVAGVWMQDWVGKRKTAAGSQLWWNWELDENWYPDWDGLVNRIDKDFNGRVLCYINAFLVDATSKGNVKRNLYAEAVNNGYLAKKANGSIYEVTNTDFAAGMIDLTSADARTWIKNIIKDNMITKGRCSGWMHDFAEALPFDAVLASGEPASRYHNQYAEDWAKVGREAINEAGKGDDIVFFNRAGYTRTPAWSTLVWQGDQMVTWDEHDGFQSAVIATLSGGFSGISLNHSDIGGYTNASRFGLGFDREETLLLRWMEFSAFTAAYRTHEGLAPETNAQFYDNPTTYDHFSRFAKVYKALAFYRKTLMQEASSKGYPVVRHPMLHYPDDARLATLTDHLMLGDEFLIAPVVDKPLPGETRENQWKKVYFPDAGKTVWVHLFTGETFGKDQPYTPPLFNVINPATGNQRWVQAPFGTPPVFYRQGSTIGAQAVANMRALGVIP
jgi:alpha-glucosidase (family GH31 glycosyl hydrolase)